MDTKDLRALIAKGAADCRGRVWPNGLGFDRGGVSYTISERPTGYQWQAAKQYRYAVKHGEGATPEAAKRAAGIGRGPALLGRRR